MSKERERFPTQSSQADVDSFLRKVSASPRIKRGQGRGRLIFGLDATASREPTWDRACDIQAKMFGETASLGGLDIQLCFYRGFREFQATPWLSDSGELLQRMTRVVCAAGKTQIRRLLRHAIAEASRGKVDAAVFVGDCMEEDLDAVCATAGELGLLGVPIFLFHEGYDAVAERAFREVARLTRGAYCRFDAASPDQLRDLLSAVAVYVAGGRQALTDFGQRRGGVALQLTHQLDKS
jgi:hypothetical protein